MSVDRVFVLKYVKEYDEWRLVLGKAPIIIAGTKERVLELARERGIDAQQIKV